MAAILAKLGVASRREAAAFARRPGFTGSAEMGTPARGMGDGTDPPGRPPR